MSLLSQYTCHPTQIRAQNLESQHPSRTFFLISFLLFHSKLATCSSVCWTPFFPCTIKKHRYHTVHVITEKTGLYSIFSYNWLCNVKRQLTALLNSFCLSGRCSEKSECEIFLSLDFTRGVARAIKCWGPGCGRILVISPWLVTKGAITRWAGDHATFVVTRGSFTIFCHHVTLVKTIYMGHHQLTSWSSHLGDDQRGDHWSGTPRSKDTVFKLLKSARKQSIKIFLVLREICERILHKWQILMHISISGSVIFPSMAAGCLGPGEANWRPIKC